MWQANLSKERRCIKKIAHSVKGVPTKKKEKQQHSESAVPVITASVHGLSWGVSFLSVEL